MQRKASPPTSKSESPISLASDDEVVPMNEIHVPADVPDELIETYRDNMLAATAGTGSMNLFACDQKIEHLNDDFYDGGKTIPLFVQ